MKASLKRQTHYLLIRLRGGEIHIACRPQTRLWSVLSSPRWALVTCTLCLARRPK